MFGTIDCLTLAGHTIAKYATMELDQFQAFSAWLRHEIDVQSIDPTSSNSDDQNDKDGGIEYGKVLTYIRGGMRGSKLHSLLSGNISMSKDTENMDGTTLYTSFKTQLRRLNEGAEQALAMPSSTDLSQLLSRQSRQLFEQVAEAERRNVLFGTPILLGKEYSSSVMDMRTCNQVNPTKAYLDEYN
jgi:anaphase-promoting complex subunit 4